MPKRIQETLFSFPRSMRQGRESEVFHYMDISKQKCTLFQTPNPNNGGNLRNLPPLGPPAHPENCLEQIRWLLLHTQQKTMIQWQEDYFSGTFLASATISAAWVRSPWLWLILAN